MTTAVETETDTSDGSTANLPDGVAWIGSEADYNVKTVMRPDGVVDVVSEAAFGTYVYDNPGIYLVRYANSVDQGSYQAQVQVIS